MQTISLCMIVKNEGAHLETCLTSVADIVDEIIVVDTGSSDATKEIARRFTDRVLDFVWVDDFSKARNYAFDQATMDYIFWLDADDVLLEPDRAKMKQLKEALTPSTDCVMMKYNTGFDNSGHVTFSFFRERLVRRALKCRWHDPVHEYLAVYGNIHQERRYFNRPQHRHLRAPASRRRVGLATGSLLLCAGTERQRKVSGRHPLFQPFSRYRSGLGRG